MDSSKRKVLGVGVEISQSNSVSETGLQSLKFLEGEKKARGIRIPERKSREQFVIWTPVQFEKRTSHKA